MGSISHHNVPLVINSLGGRRTHAQTHTRTYTHTPTSIQTFADRSNSKKPGVPACSWHAPGLKNQVHACASRYIATGLNNNSKNNLRIYNICAAEITCYWISANIIVKCICIYWWINIVHYIPSYIVTVERAYFIFLKIFMLIMIYSVENFS